MYSLQTTTYKQKRAKKSVSTRAYIAHLLISALFFAAPSMALASPINASDLIYLTNQERVKEGLPELIPNHQLTQAAQHKAQDMLLHGYFSHTTPSGKPFYQWVEEQRYHYLYAGENLAIDFAANEGVVAAWMDSPLHRQNIVNNNYTDIGIVALRGNWKDHETTVVVQLFGSLLTDSPTVLGRALENMSKDFKIRRDSLETLAADMIMLPSIAGPQYFDIMIRSRAETQLAVSNPNPVSVASSPTTKIAQNTTYQTLLKSDDACCQSEATFALTEESSGATFSTPISYPSVAATIKNVSLKSFSYPSFSQSTNTNLLITGMLIILLLIASEMDIKQLFMAAK